VKTRLSLSARRQADQLDRWWRRNRAATAGLFARELAEAREMLAHTPELGTVYAERRGAVARRVLLPKTKNHVYYEVDRASGMVTVLAVWGAPRVRGPKL
jgi:plasmid stabilization system protein ParE